MKKTAFFATLVCISSTVLGMDHSPKRNFSQFQEDSTGENNPRKVQITADRSIPQANEFQETSSENDESQYEEYQGDIEEIIQHLKQLPAGIHDSQEDDTETTPSQDSEAQYECKQEDLENQIQYFERWEKSEQQLQLLNHIAYEKEDLTITNEPLAYTLFPNLVSLTLRSISLSKSPVLMFKFPKLKKLQISSCSDVFGEALTTLLLNNINVEELYINGSNLKYFPIEITGFQKLKILDLSSNLIRSLPAEICELESLEELYLNTNLLTALPDEIFNIQHPLILTAYANYLSPLPQTIGNLKVFNIHEELVWKNPARFLKRLNENHAIFTQKDIKNKLKSRYCNRDNIETIFGKIFKETLCIGENVKGVPVYTSRDYYQLEQDVMEHFQNILDNPARIPCPKTIIDRVLNNYSWFSEEQKLAVRILTTDQNLCILIGRAGAGKTTTMKAVSEIYESSGARIIGMSMAALASENLGKEANVESKTIARWINEEKSGYREWLGQQNESIDVIIVDEASMIGTQDWFDILELAQKYKSKIILTGDDNQLKPISSGDCFRAVLETLNQNNIGYLSNILRQEENWQKEASIELSKLNIHKALSIYDQHGKIHEMTSPQQIAEKFLELEKQDSAAVICNSNELRHKLNKQIHDLKINRGILGKTIAEIAGKSFSLNEKIIFTQNNWEAGVKNGEVATVQNFENGILTVETEDGLKNIIIENIDPKDPKKKQIVYNKIDYAYAITVTKSQGKTYDDVIVIAHAMMDCKSTYVAMTRHKKNVDLYYKKSNFAQEQTPMERSCSFRDVKGLISRLSRYERKDLAQDYDDEENPYKSRVREYIKLSKEMTTTVGNIKKNEATWKDWETIQAERSKIGKEIAKDYKNHKLYTNQNGLTLEKVKIDCKLPFNYGL